MSESNEEIEVLKLTNNAVEPNDFFIKISQFLDEYFYEHCFVSEKGYLEKKVIDIRFKFGYIKKGLDMTLTVPKLFLAFSSSIFFVVSLNSAVTSPTRSAFCLFCSYELFKMSYNCYSIKFYSIAVRKNTFNPDIIILDGTFTKYMFGM